jgi:hypothetical protein
MRFEKVALLSGVTVLAGSIVILPSSSVNRNTTTNGATQIQVADGATQIQVADGAPLPPLPPTAKSAFFPADGAKLPPLPPTTQSPWLLADAAPLPQLPPTAAV